VWNEVVMQSVSSKSRTQLARLVGKEKLRTETASIRS